MLDDFISLQIGESDAVWTTLSMSLNLVNVTMEMIPSFSFGEIPSRPDTAKHLGKLDFVQSKFVYESFSDGSKSMDLVSHGVLLHDIRNNGKILQSLRCYLLKNLPHIFSIAWEDLVPPTFDN